MMERMICTACKTTVDPHEDGGVACECQHRHPADPVNDPYADSWMYVTDACNSKGPYPGVGGYTTMPSCPQCARFKAKLDREKVAKVLFMVRYNVPWEEAHQPSAFHRDALRDVDAIIKHLTE